MSLPDSIEIIECHYVAPTKMSSYLVIEGDRAAFIDNGTRFSVPYLLESLTARGMRPEQVAYIIITHVHLDHAGGTAELLKQCPNAAVLAHPKAARHLCKPDRLVQGAIAVYGEELFRNLYGDVEGVPEDRVRTVADGEVVTWGERTLRFFNTLGHCSHHFCIHDEKTNSVFAGDNFGIGRSEELRPGPPFLICTCTPPEFDAAESKRSIDAIVATGADRVYVGHFGVFTDVARGAEQMHRSIDGMQEIIQAALADGSENAALEAFIATRMAAATDDQLRWCGVSDFESDRRWVDPDLMLNVLGLKFAVERMRKKGTADGRG